MSTTLTVNGVGYSFPAVGDRPWGQKVINWATAVTSGMLQKAGGTFTLTADVDFGASYGLLVAYLTSQDAAPAAAGIIRLGNDESVSWRNAGDSADLALKANTSDKLEFNGNKVVDVAGGTNTLAAEIDFGATYGVKSAWIKTQTANPSATEPVRLANNEGIGWRNAANGADLVLKAIASDELEYGGINLQPLTTRGDIIIRDATGNNVRLAVGGVGEVLKSDGTDIAWGSLAGTGDVVGPGSATDNAVPRFDTTTGKLIQNSGVVVDDTNAVSGLKSIQLNNGATDGGEVLFDGGGSSIKASADGLTLDLLSSGFTSVKFFPATTAMLFYQASAPTGWTAAAVNDYFIRAVNAGGTGGSTGGTLNASSDIGSHTHAGPSHTHTGTTAIESQGSKLQGAGPDEAADDDHTHTFTTAASGTGNTGVTSLGAGAFKRADVIIATKD